MFQRSLCNSTLLAAKAKKKKEKRQQQQARVVVLFPGKVGFARVFPVPHCLPPQITARLQQHPMQREPLQRGFHAASHTAQALPALTFYFPDSSSSLLFQLRFTISILHNPIPSSGCASL